MCKFACVRTLLELTSFSRACAVCSTQREFVDATVEVDDAVRAEAAHIMARELPEHHQDVPGVQGHVLDATLAPDSPGPAEDVVTAPFHVAPAQEDATTGAPAHPGMDPAPGQNHVDTDDAALMEPERTEMVANVHTTGIARGPSPIMNMHNQFDSPGPQPSRVSESDASGSGPLCDQRDTILPSMLKRRRRSSGIEGAEEVDDHLLLQAVEAFESSPASTASSATAEHTSLATS